MNREKGKRGTDILEENGPIKKKKKRGSSQID